MVIDTLKALIAEMLGIEENALQPDTNFVSDTGADSLEYIELILKIEETYGVEITDENFQKTTSLGELASWIEDALKSKTNE